MSEYGEPLQSAVDWLRTTHEGTLSGERIAVVLDALDRSTRHAAVGWAQVRAVTDLLNVALDHLIVHDETCKLLSDIPLALRQIAAAHGDGSAGVE